MAATEVVLNNPAGRLHFILSRAKRTGASSVSDAFAVALDVPKGDILQVMLKLGMLGLAVDEVSQQLTSINAVEVLEIYSESVPRLKAALTIQNVGTNWESHKNLIRDDDLKTLRFCSLALSKASFEEVLSDEQLKDFKSKVDALYEELLKSNEVEPELRQVVLEHLESIRRAIHDYRVRGIRPLEEALCVTAVTLALRKDSAMQDSEDESKPDGKKSEKPKPVIDRVRRSVRDMMLAIKFWKLVYPWMTASVSHFPQLQQRYEEVKAFLGLS